VFGIPFDGVLLAAVVKVAAIIVTVCGFGITVFSFLKTSV
jgi:hypothetical protein